MNTSWTKNGGFDMREKVLRLVAVYLDDLLMVGAGVCFVSAAALMGGPAAALAVAGVWLAVCALTVARAKRGEG